MTRPQYERVAISSLKFDKRNARKHDKKNIKSIKDSLTRFGQKKPIVVGADGSVVAGNGTLQAAIELGWDTIDVNKTELKGEEAIAYAIADNRTAELAEWDDENLKASLEELDEAGWDLDGLGFDADDLKDLLPETGTAGLTDEDDVPEVEQNVFGVKIGDIWQLGNHRLMCGDSTEKANVEKLMNGEKADMVFTDPPYGIDIGNQSQGKGGGIAKKINYGKNDWDKKIPYEAIEIAKSLSNSCVLWGGNYYADRLPPSSCWIVWNKDNGDTDFADVELAWTSFKNASRIVTWKWCGMLQQDMKNKEKRVHPTQKPTALAEWTFKKFNVGKIIIDLFLGSGSTLIACEKTGRKCYGLELDPHYCSVIIKRWQDFTGKEVVKL